MKNGQKLLVTAAASLALSTTAFAINSERTSPYQGIVERNLFGLKPPPPPPSNEDANKPQPSKITLTGITTILGKKIALMKTPGPPPKPGEQPKPEQSYMLAVGERVDQLEVVEIDEKAGLVKVLNAGTPENVTWKDNGVKPGGGGPAAPPAVAGNHVPGAPINPYAPAAPATPGAAPAGIPMPSRIPRTPLPGAPGTAGMVNPAGNSAMSSLPTSFGSAPAVGNYSPTPNVRVGNLGLPAGGFAAQPVAQTPGAGLPIQVTPEEQIIHMEVQRQLPDSPPLPPTELTPPELNPLKNQPPL